MSEILPLIEILEKIPDPRKAKGKRYKLSSILLICFMATICGYKHYSGFSEFCKNYKDVLSDILLFDNKTPCEVTFFNVLKKVGIKKFEKIICKWVETILSEEEAISIDGKTLRGTKKQGGKYYHLLSAFSERFGITVFQSSVDSKTNEITGVIELLKGLTIEGKIFTMDALLTQKAIAKTIVSGKGDYVMIAKDNQEFLREDIELLVEADEKFGITEEYIQTEKGHGRIETRKITLTDSKDIIEFPGVNQVFMIERWVKKPYSANQNRYFFTLSQLLTYNLIGTLAIYFFIFPKESYERVFGLTSLKKEKANAKRILSLVRGHWGIENRSHWVRDVTFDEDRSQVKDSEIAQFMALFRNIAIGLIRFAGFVNISKALRFYASNPVLALPLFNKKIK